MKKTGIITTIIAALLLLPSCKDRQKSLAEWRRDEKTAIRNFIEENKITILEEYPKNGEFKENEYLYDPSTGIYYNIVDHGDNKEDIKLGEVVYIRFRGLRYLMSGDTTLHDVSNMFDKDPITMTYIGPIDYYNSYTYTNQGTYTPPGWIVPLAHVGHNGCVRIIVPFEMGAGSDQSNYTTAYYNEVHYRFKSKINNY